MTIENMSEIIEKVYYDNPRLNSKSQLRDILDMETDSQLNCSELDFLFDKMIHRINNPKSGEFLEVEHSRKGKFILHVRSVSDEWIEGIIVVGTAMAIMDYNIKEEGETVTCRRSLCCFYPMRPLAVVEASP